MAKKKTGTYGGHFKLVKGTDGKKYYVDARHLRKTKPKKRR